MKKSILYYINIALFLGIVFLIFRNINTEDGTYEASSIQLPSQRLPQMEGTQTAPMQQAMASSVSTPRAYIDEARRKKIKWMDINDAEKEVADAPKKVFVDLYTDWCGWCKVMDRETFTDEVVVERMVRDFYAVKFDAEGGKAVTFRGEEYDVMGRTSELAIALTGGRLIYPSSVVLDEKLEVLASVPGYMNAERMRKLLTYFGENRHEEEEWEDYLNNEEPPENSKEGP